MAIEFQKSERAAREANRAAKVTLNAGVRRAKARLMEDVVKLQKLSVKKVTRSITRHFNCDRAHKFYQHKHSPSTLFIIFFLNRSITRTNF